MSDSAPYKQSSEGLSAPKKRPAEIAVPLGEKHGHKRIAPDPVGGQLRGGYFKLFDSDGEESDSPVEVTAPSSASLVSDGSGDKEETGSSSEKTTGSSSSPVSDGSGGGKGAGSSGKETAPPSVSPVSDGSGGGEEAGSKTVNGKEPETQESGIDVGKKLYCDLFDHVEGCKCPCTPLEHTPSCTCFQHVDDDVDWDRSLKHVTREAIWNGEHLKDSDDEI